MNCSCKQDEDGYVIEAVINVDERGQMVMPKEVREKIGVQPGDKFALVSKQKNNKVCCLYLIRTDEFSGMVETILQPLEIAINKK